MPDTRAGEAHRREPWGLAAIAAAVALASGCSQWSGLSHGVAHPMTPEQSRAQVVDAAKEVVGALGLHYVSASFSHESCNDDGVAPFRGNVVISYPLAANLDQDNTERTAMLAHLQTVGWEPNPSLRSHSPTLEKNHVVLQLRPQSVDSTNRVVDLSGECRDVTTTKDQAGTITTVDLHSNTSEPAPTTTAPVAEGDSGDSAVYGRLERHA